MNKINSNREFISSFSPVSILKAFDHQPGVILWIKDSTGIYQYGNEEFLRHFFIKSIDDLIGCNDYDLAPKYLADSFTVDDKFVLSGNDIRNRLELVSFKDDKVDWYMTDKSPLRDNENNVVGTIGITRKASGVEGLRVPEDSMTKVMEYIQLNFKDTFSVKEVAGLCCLSVSAFERKFKKFFQTTPTEYILKFRVNRVCRLLAYTQQPVSDIALECGFCDHSYMTRQFKKMMGCSPTDFRIQNRKI